MRRMAHEEAGHIDVPGNRRAALLHPDVRPECAGCAAASLLGMAGAVLFGTCAGTLLQLKRLSRDPDYRQRQKAQCDERNQAIRDRVGCIAGFWTVGLVVVSGLIFQSFERFGIPDWVGWVFIGIYLFYTLAFLGLYKWLQRKM